jgi:hypothetical protein
MAHIQKLKLDVLKPHKPNVCDFALALAELNKDWHVELTLIEIDEQTQTVLLDFSGKNIEFELIQASISKMGATVHSIDAVEATSLLDDL